MKLKFTNFVLIFFFVHKTLTALDYPTMDKIEIKIIPSIVFHRSQREYSFDFEVVSTQNSVQDVVLFQIFVDRPFSYLNSPYGWGNLKENTIPKNDLLRGAKWYATYADDDPRGNEIPTDDSEEKPSPNSIKPGFSKNGFALKSHNLPGICEFFCQGFIQPPDMYDYPDDFVPPPYRDRVFVGKTVGPVEVLNKTSENLLNRLKQLKDSCPTFGWITKPGIVNSLNVKLHAAIKNLEKGKTKTAINELEAFIHELDAQKGKGIDDNAYALLKPNAEYLIYILNNNQP